ncbi:MAG: methyltransferase [Pseudomonadota bacterium]
MAGRLAAAWAARRNALVAAPWFQRFAGRFWPFRAVAAREAARLFDLTAGFVYSQVLAAVVRLGLVERLAAGPMGEAALVEASGLPPAALRRLMEGAEAIDLVERLGEARSETVWGLSMLGAALAANAGAVAMIRHHDMLYRDLEDPVALLAGGRTAAGAEPEIGRFWAYARDPGAEGRLAQTFGPEAVDAYSALMAASQDFIAEQVLDRLPLGRIATLVDMGGGEGAFVEAAARRAPHLRLGLLDLPAVAERARTRLAAAGLGDRIEVRGGDFFRDAAPFAAEGGADAVSLVRVLYDHDDAFVAGLLRRARAALKPGGRLIVAEPMAGLAGGRRAGAYFALYLAAMGSGRIRRPAEIAALARAAGFTRIRRLRTAQPVLCGLVTARA